MDAEVDSGYERGRLDERGQILRVWNSWNGQEIRRRIGMRERQAALRGYGSRGREPSPVVGDIQNVELELGNSNGRVDICKVLHGFGYPCEGVYFAQAAARVRAVFATRLRGWI